MPDPNVDIPPNNTSDAPGARAPAPDPEFCFIIPAGSGEQLHLGKCVRSAHQAADEAGRRCDVLVVFDGPATAELQAEVAKAGAEFLLLPEKGGPAAARNRGVEATKAPIIFFIDADVVLEPAALRRALVAITDQGYDGVIGAYAPRTPVHGVVSRLKNLQHSFVHTSNPGPIRSFWTACSAVTRDAYLSVEGLDEHQRYCEDIALGIKMARAGKKILLDPEVSGIHMKEYTLISWLHSDLVGRAIPWSLLILTGRAEMGQLNTGKGGIVSLLAAITIGVSLLLAPWFPVLLLLLCASSLVFALLNRGFFAYVNRYAGWGERLGAGPFLLLHSAVALLGFSIAWIKRAVGAG